MYGIAEWRAGSLALSSCMHTRMWGVMPPTQIDDAGITTFSFTTGTVSFRSSGLEGLDEDLEVTHKPVCSCLHLVTNLDSSISDERVRTHAAGPAPKMHHHRNEMKCWYVVTWQTSLMPTADGGGRGFFLSYEE